MTPPPEGRFAQQIPMAIAPENDAHRRLTASRASVAQRHRESIARDNDLLRATRKSLAMRQQPNDVADQMDIVEEALAAAHKQHRQSVSRALRRSIGEAPPDDDAYVHGQQSLQQSILEDRIQEVAALVEVPRCIAVNAEEKRQTLAERCQASGGHKSFRKAVLSIRTPAMEQQDLKDRALKHAETVKPNDDDLLPGEGNKWIVVGGEHVNGIIVRSGESLSSKALPVRLSFGARIEEIERCGNRLHYRRLTGDGPNFGWASVELPQKQLLLPL